MESTARNGGESGGRAVSNKTPQESPLSPKILVAQAFDRSINASQQPLFIHESPSETGVQTGVGLFAFPGTRFLLSAHLDRLPLIAHCSRSSCSRCSNCKA